MFIQKPEKLVFLVSRKLPRILERRINPDYSLLMQYDQFAIGDFRGFGKDQKSIFYYGYN